ncbi:MAG: vanadium-dependent haloperoxidase [Acidobacteria bacterium]|nr:vanadium-dependent haloperoxidase [Acidobacteriota bacterium]
MALPPTARAQDAEVVIEWNRILQATVGTTGALPQTVFFTRPYAMMHVAVFDALNSIDFVYTPYATRAESSPNASREAAAAQAAHDVMAALFPNQRAIFETTLRATLNRLPAEAAREGSQVGAAAARAILELRASDGWNRVPPQYILPALPGYWQPTPPLDAPPVFTHYPDVLGFGIASARQFLMEPPPTLTSERYAIDFNEVKTLGAANSATRTPDQTIVARVFGVVGTTLSFPGVWNNVARDMARARGLSGLETARLYALVNMAVHDALLVSFTGKFLYGLWRPITAIRAADRDANPATDADPSWTSLIGNPPYPTYPGNLACLAASASRVLHRFFGRDDIPFTVTWAGIDPAPNVTRAYNGFRQLADEAGRSRIYGGIHFTFDTLASVGVCTPLADYIVDNNLRSKFLAR